LIDRISWCTISLKTGTILIRNLRLNKEN